MATTAFPVNPELTAIAMAYRNPAHTLIAELVMPRVPTAKKFTWTAYDPAQGYTVPRTLVGRKSQPTQVDFNGVPMNDETLDYGLDDVVPNDEMEAWAAMPKPATGGPINPMVVSTMFLEGLIQLDREVRVAGRVFNAATYPAANQATLSGSNQWSDYANSNPLSAILAALDIPLLRPNIAIFGQAAWTGLRQHPKIVQAVYGTAQTGGVVTNEALAAVLEVKQVLVGGSFLNTARKGQAAVNARVWGKHASFIYSDVMAAMTGQPTFGFTAQFGNKVAGNINEPKTGLRGSELVRCGESLKEVVSAGQLGYFFQNVVS